MGNFPLIGSFLSSRLSLMIVTAFFCSSPRAMGSSVHIWQTPVRNVPGVCTDPVLSSVTKTVPLSAGLRRKGCHNRTRDPMPWFVITFSLYHQATQDVCSLYIPCLTIACFIHTLHTRLTSYIFVQAPVSDCFYQKAWWGMYPLLISLVTPSINWQSPHLKNEDCYYILPTTAAHDRVLSPQNLVSDV